jgi:dCTP deaminase
MVEHGQKVCKLAFERMVEAPDSLYGAGMGSAYQGQTVTLSRHFRR